MEFDPMQGLLNIKPQRMVDPTTQGLLAAAMAGLNASGPSRMPVGLGQVFGQALGAGTGALQQANQQNDMAQKNNLAMQMQAYQLRKGMEGEQRVAQARSVLTNPNATEEEKRAAMLTLDPQFALKQMFPEKGKPQLVTVTGTDGKPVQRWVTPGESAGVDVGPLYEPPKMQAVNGQIVDMRNVAPGTVIPPQAPVPNPFNDLIIQGPDGQPTINTRLLDAKRQIAAAGASQNPPAPSLTQIVDPANPDRMLSIDAKTYRGGSLGSPGVIGISGKEPTAAKKEDEQFKGRDQVSGLVSQLRQNFQALKDGGGIQDSTNPNPIANLFARASSTGLGQSLGQATGTANQKARDTIEQMRPLLLNAIKNATGMSAKQMDSNAEMKLYLAAATDPTKDFQANMEALDNLERLYGLSGAPKSQNPRPTPPAAPAITPPPAAVGRLRMNKNKPGEREQFDQIFGPGAAARALGEANGR